MKNIKDSIVNYIIESHSNATGDQITSNKLQKTLYYVYATWFIENEEELFKSKFVITPCGPIDKSVNSKLIRGEYDGTFILDNRVLYHIDMVTDYTFDQDDNTLTIMSVMDNTCKELENGDSIKCDIVRKEYSYECL